MPAHDPMVSTQWLAEHLDAPDVKVADATWYLPTLGRDARQEYAQAHVLSSTTQTFHHGFLESLGNLKTLWTLRNDDALLLRWAAPDFVREFVRNIPLEKSQGYYFGSDMWVWGREFLSQLPGTQRQLGALIRGWIDTGAECPGE